MLGSTLLGKKISFTFEHKINKLLVRSTSVRLYLIIFPQANNVDPDLNELKG